MRRLCILSLFCCTTAHAITWDFNEDGNAQGWYAREGPYSLSGSDLQPLAYEVSDGLLRVRPRPYASGIYPSIRMVSPILGYESSLFDRVEARVRLVAPRPVIGRVLLNWTNPQNRTWPGLDPVAKQGENRFLWVSAPTVTFTTEWQTVKLSGFADAAEVVWADTLDDIRVTFNLPGGSVEAMPEALDIDWIRLTGAEEQLWGELAPPLTSTPVPGALFAPAQYQSLSLPGLVQPILGQLDGDGDLDVLVSGDYVASMSDPQQGWLAA
ncbi:MAG: hypothetical protein WDA75_23200, partial [Candidatus Latescibacterota bacterium]